MGKRGFPRGVVVYSDRGSQFASRKFRAVLKPFRREGLDGSGRGVWG